jgi:hypothetical protein
MKKYFVVTITTLFFSNTLFGADFTVSTVAELQTALNTAQANGEDDSIRINAGTYNVSSNGELTFTSTEAFKLEIIGVGEVLFDGGGTNRMFNINSTNGKVIFDNLRFENGFCAGYNLDGGGAIFANQNNDIEVHNSFFKNNVGTSGTNSWGGAIFTFNLTKTLIVNSKFVENDANYGGAIFFYNDGEINIINSSFVNNEAFATGGAIRTHNVEITIFNSLFSGNSASTGADLGLSNPASADVYNSHTSIGMIDYSSTFLSNTIDSGLVWEDLTTLSIAGNSSTVGAGLSLSEVQAIVDSEIGQTLTDFYDSCSCFGNIGAFEPFDPSNIQYIISASLDLVNYDQIKVIFDLSKFDSTVLSLFSNDITNGDIFVTNSKSDDNATLLLDYNISNEVFLSLENQSGIDSVRKNSTNNLKLHFKDSSFNDANISKDFDLTKTLGSTSFGDLNVTNENWNLITIPHGLYTNSREMVKSNKVNGIWGWELNLTTNKYEWIAYPTRMEAGRGYWVRTRVPQNTFRNLSDVIASDFEPKVIGDYDGSEINTSSLIEIVSKIPNINEWVLVGNSGSDAEIVSSSGTENNSSIYYYEDLLNKTENCYFVSMYHWKADTEEWVDAVYGGETSEAIPFGSGMWVKQQLCDQ